MGKYITVALVLLLSGCYYGPAPKEVQLAAKVNRACVDKVCTWTTELVAAHDNSESFSGAAEKARALIGLTAEQWQSLESNPNLISYLKKTSSTELYFELRKAQKNEIIKLMKVWPKMAEELDLWSSGVKKEASVED